VHIVIKNSSDKNLDKCISVNCKNVPTNVRKNMIKNVHTVKDVPVILVNRCNIYNLEHIAINKDYHNFFDPVVN